MTGVTRPAHSLEECGNAAGRTNLADQFDRSDIDAEFKRSGGHEGLELAGTEFAFDAFASVLRQGSVVGSYPVVAQPFCQLVGDPFGHTTGVYEDQSGVMLLDHLGDLVE